MLDLLLDRRRKKTLFSRAAARHGNCMLRRAVFIANPRSTTPHAQLERFDTSETTVLAQRTEDRQVAYTNTVNDFGIRDGRWPPHVHRRPDSRCGTPPAARFR